MSLRTALKALFGTAWHVQGDDIIDGMTVATDGTAEANKPLVLDANKDATGVRHFTLSGNLVVGSTTISETDLQSIDGVLATPAEINRAADLSSRVVSLAVSTVITEAAHEGRTILMSGAGSARTFTLPPATGAGGRYRFVVGEVNTSGYLIKSVAGADLMEGIVLGMSTTDSTTDAVNSWLSGATDDTITLDGTTTGGAAVGDWIELEDLSATGWYVRGMVTQSGTEATPFSDTVA